MGRVGSKEQEPQKKPFGTPKLRGRKRKLPRRRLAKEGPGSEAPGKDVLRGSKGRACLLHCLSEGGAGDKSAVGLVIRSVVRGECCGRVAGQAGGLLWLGNDAVRQGVGCPQLLPKIHL